MKNLHLKIGILVLAFIFFLVDIEPVKAEPYGWSPSVDNSWQGPPKCTDAKPDKAPVLLQPNHPVLPKKPKKGEVVLYWHKVPGATGYNVYYGLSPKNYIFSAPDIGDTNNFTVGYLPNKIFYFAVQAKKGCAAGNLSQEWNARPGYGGYAGLAASTGNPIVRTYTPPPKPVTKQTIILPTTAPDIKGVDTNSNTNQNYQPQEPYIPPSVPPAVQPAKPKAKGFFEMIWSLLFGK